MGNRRIKKIGGYNGGLTAAQNAIGVKIGAKQKRKKKKKGS